VYESVYNADDRTVKRANPKKLFGQRIRDLRAERGLNQEELAEKVGVFRTYMSRIETGVANPTLTMVYALADALGVEVVALFGTDT
jgi:transcriptional regulator with XRE-family HTH domain